MAEIKENKRIFKKNDEVEIEIIYLTYRGDGIGKYEGFTIFVKGALIGDIVVAHLIYVQKRYANAIIAKIVKPSEHRVESPCPVAGKCGGCQVMNLKYEEQLKMKQSKVYNCLKRIGGIENPNVLDIKGMEYPYFYRNKAQFPVGEDKLGKPLIGFYSMRSHNIISSDDCYIESPDFNAVKNVITAFMEKYKVKAYDEKTRKGILRHVLMRKAHATGEIMVCLIINADKLPHEAELLAMLMDMDFEGDRPDGIPDEVYGKKPFIKCIAVNVNKENTNIILGRKTYFLTKEKNILDKIGDVSFEIAPQSFFQVNPLQTRKLYETALEYAELDGSQVVWDLYCGIGTISLFLARKAKKVYGVEIVPEAIENAKKNAEINGIENAVFECGPAEEIVEKMLKNVQEKADVVVVDPPRAGLDEKLISTVVGMQPERIVYVSCDPATLARDVKLFGEQGYEFVKAQPVDMFSATVHVETVVQLSKGDVKLHLP